MVNSKYEAFYVCLYSGLYQMQHITRDSLTDLAFEELGYQVSNEQSNSLLKYINRVNI